MLMYDDGKRTFGTLDLIIGEYAKVTFADHFSASESASEATADTEATKYISKGAVYRQFGVNDRLRIGCIICSIFRLCTCRRLSNIGRVGLWGDEVYFVPGVLSS